MNETHESSVCNILRYFYTIFKPIYQNVSSVCSYVVLYLRANSIFLNADTPNTKNDWNALMVRKGRMAFINERLFLYQEESILSGREYHARRAFLNEAIITSLGAIHIGSSFSSAMD